MHEFVPAGFLTHVEAFERYVRQVRDPELFDAVNPYDQTKKDDFQLALNWSAEWNAKWETYASDFVRHLVDGELTFLVAHPQTGAHIRILPEDWKSDFWPQRPFMSATIQCAGDSKLFKFTGKIPFVESNAFQSWLEKLLPIFLLGEIQNGRLLPNEADERLANMNLPALHPMPPLASFRDAVLNEPYWTLSMTVAWIAWGNIDCVVKQYQPYAKPTGWWRVSKVPRQAKEGMVWETALEPRLSDLIFFEAAESYLENPPKKFIKESRQELWRALQAGELTAIGIEGAGSHKKINSERWVSLEIQTPLNGIEFVGAGLFGDGEKIYDVKLSSKEILLIWPASNEHQQHEGKSQLTLATLTEHELNEAYKVRVENWPISRQPPNRDDDYKWFQTISQQVTRDMARRIRADNAPENWTQQGRRPVQT